MGDAGPGNHTSVHTGDVGILLLRGLAGGALVLVFAQMAEVVSPKAFSGLFAAAPSVAVASLAITAASEGAKTARQDSIGMVVGGIAMAACCVVAVVAIPRVQALRGSAASWVAWLVVAMGLYWAVFVGVR